MAFYVYIIQSTQDASYYKGCSEDPQRRLEQHNLGLSAYTCTKLPWRLVYVEAFPEKREALIRERQLKKYSHLQIEKLRLTALNVVSRFLNTTAAQNLEE